MLPRLSLSLYSPTHSPAPVVEVKDTPTRQSQDLPAVSPAVQEKREWSAYVRDTYARLKTADPCTTYSQAMKHASATWKQ